MGGGHGGADAGVVDQYVHVTEFLHSFGDDPVAVFRVRDVGLDRDAPAAQGFDPGAGFLELLNATRTDRDVGTGLGQTGGKGHPEPG